MSQSPSSIHRYSLPQAPSSLRWETTLCIRVPEQPNQPIRADFVSMTFSALDTPVLVRAPLDEALKGLNAGQEKRFPLNMKGGAALIESTVPLSVTLEITDFTTGDQTKWRLNPLGRHPYRLLQGLHQRQETEQAPGIIATLAVANHADHRRPIELLIRVCNAKTGQPMGAWRKTLEVGPHLNRTILIAELLEELQLEKGNWQLTIQAHAPGGNFDLVGTNFTQGQPQWLTSKPAVKK
jgi:hypothetical protein